MTAPYSFRVADKLAKLVLEWLAKKEDKGDTEYHIVKAVIESHGTIDQALRAAARPEERATAALAWAVRTFGDVALDPRERACRFIEEAIELVNALGLQDAIVHALVERVYQRQKGDLRREMGQARLTLDLLAEVLDIPAGNLAAEEFARIQAVPQEEWTRRHAAKVALGIANVAHPSPQKGPTT